MFPITYYFPTPTSQASYLLILQPQFSYFSENYIFIQTIEPLNSNLVQESSIISEKWSETHCQNQDGERERKTDVEVIKVRNQQQSHFVCQNENDVEKRKNRKMGKQKFGRNITSNIFIAMLRFLLHSKKMKAYLQRIINTYNMTIKISQFYRAVGKKLKKYGGYINQRRISEMCLGGDYSNQSAWQCRKEQQIGKIIRIAGRVYLDYHHIPYVYNSNKIKSESKKHHFPTMRKIFKFDQSQIY